MKTSLLAYTYMLWMLACSSGSGGFEYATTDARSVAPSMEESMQSSENGGTGTEPLTPKKIIRNGTMSISVGKAAETREEVSALLSNRQAYISNEHLENSDYQTLYSLQIRVPADQLDALVADIESLKGTVTAKSIQARDVTEEYIDLETRMANKQAYLEQYRALLKNAKTIEDILKVREQIRVLEEEIESVTGRLKYLSSQVSLSTLDLSIYQKKDYVYTPDRNINFFERLKESLSGGWFAFISFVLYMIGLWPFWIAGAVGIFLWKRLRKRKTPPLPPKV